MEQGSDIFWSRPSWWDSGTDPDVVEVLDRLRDSRSTTWLRIVNDARLDAPVSPPDDAAFAVEPYR